MECMKNLHELINRLPSTSQFFAASVMAKPSPARDVPKPVSYTIGCAVDIRKAPGRTR
jgi:hypothetical protein